MSTRGAQAWVRRTPTGLPHWTSRVSSSARTPQLADDGVEGVPVARRPPGPAVDDEVVGVLGDLRVEVVHEHPQGRFLGPAPAGQLGAARGADGSRAGGPDMADRLLRQVGHDLRARAGRRRRPDETTRSGSGR